MVFGDKVLAVTKVLKVALVVLIIGVVTAGESICICSFAPAFKVVKFIPVPATSFESKKFVVVSVAVTFTFSSPVADESICICSFAPGFKVVKVIPVPATSFESKKFVVVSVAVIFTFSSRPVSINLLAKKA